MKQIKIKWHGLNLKTGKWESFYPEDFASVKIVKSDMTIKDVLRVQRLSQENLNYFLNQVINYYANEDQFEICQKLTEIKNEYFVGNSNHEKLHLAISEFWKKEFRIFIKDNIE